MMLALIFGVLVLSGCKKQKTVAIVDIWTPLPCIRTDVTTGSDGGDYYYTTFIDYEWTVGTVNIFVTTSDLYTGDRPGDMSFRVFIHQ